LFFFAQITGLFIINQNFEHYGVENFRNNELFSDAIFTLPVSIIIFSLLFLLIYKLNMKKLLIVWYAFAFIACVTISLSSFINFYYAVFISACLLLLKFVSNDDFLHNMLELLVYGGIAVVVIPLLSPVSAILLLIIISIYDFIAVYFSKHMIILAKTQFALNIFSGLQIRTGGKGAILGGGDIAFPLILAGVMLRDYSAINAILIIYGSLIGLTILILTGEDDKFYPAMPFITMGCLFGYVLGLFFL